MKGNLVIIIKDNNIDLVFGISNIPVATMSRNYEKIDELESLLLTFMNSNNIDYMKIKNIIFVIDFTNFINNIKKCSFGYIQFGDIPDNKLQTKEFMKNIKLDIYNLNISSSNSKDYKNQLHNYLNSLYEKGINKIALNSFFSALNPYREKKLIKDIKSIYPNTFEVYPSYSYNSFNYLLRENVMFLDLLLLETVSNFKYTINRIFDNLNIHASIYFMKGSGTLTSLRIASISPIFTWQSLFASQLIGAGITTGEKDALVLTKHNEGIKIGIIQNKLPKLSETFSNFEGLNIPNYFPRSTFLNILQDNKKWRNFLKSNNPFTGPVPIISFIDNFYSQPFFTYPVIKIEKHPSILAQGALNSFFQLELTSIVTTSDPNIIEEEKKNLISKSRKILEKDNIKLKSIDYVHETNPIKYILHDAFYIKLYVKGYI